MVSRLHLAAPVTRRGRSEGFSLVELMVVVVIVGVLAALAVVAYTRYIRKARTTEVSKIFGELSAKEQLYHSEMGEYLDTAAWHPASVSNSAQAVTPLPATWRTLKVQPGSSSVYCQYRVYAGAPGGALGDYGTLYSSAPETNWFYMAARCDFDNDGRYSTYLMRGDSSDLVRENDGE